MNIQTNEEKIQRWLRQMPKAQIPADLVALIESKTLLKQSWWQTEAFRARWLPAFVGIATAVGALWLSKMQSNPRPQVSLPMAAAPVHQPVVAHALLPHTESSNEDKGESRDN